MVVVVVVCVGVLFVVADHVVDEEDCCDVTADVVSAVGFDVAAMWLVLPSMLVLPLLWPALMWLWCLPLCVCVCVAVETDVAVAAAVADGVLLRLRLLLLVLLLMLCLRWLLVHLWLLLLWWWW